MAATANKQFIRRAGTLSALIALGYASSAPALDWKFEPSVDASATYTDNARQSANNPDDALILGLTPGFVLRSEGSRRVEATMQYGLRGILRIGDDRSDTFQHNLGAFGKAEVVEDFLFIEGNARISQELISLLGSPAGADVNDSNRANVGTYSVSPYIKKRLGTFAQTEVRYTASGATYGDAAASNSSTNAFTASLASGTRFNDVDWKLNYSIRDNVNKDDVDTRFESASAMLGYKFSRKFRVFATAGQEWNEYPVLAGTETEGGFYSIGFGWAPSRRTSLEMSAGERYIGSTYSLSARHRTRMTNWNLSYAEDVNDLSQFVQTSGTVYTLECPGVSKQFDWPYAAPPPSGCLIVNSTPGAVFDLRSGVFIAKTLRAGVSMAVRKTTYALNYADSNRHYTTSGGEDHTRSLSLSAAYRMTPQTTLNGSLTFSSIQVSAVLAGTARDDDWSTLSLGVDHRFADKLSGALIFRHIERDSNVAAGDYTENSLTASVNMRF